MPHITTAMERSLRRGLGDYFFGSFLGRRAITDDVNNVKNSFSSWDNCMQASYCKWPVIAIIIVGGLILFSILWCAIRCLCCGMSCCCTCFSFLKCCDCCGCCGGCCDGKKDRKMKYLDEEHSRNIGGGYAPNQGYQAPAPMMNGGLITSRDPIPDSVPKFAQFEVGKNGLYTEPKPAGVSEDALPPMPSWDSASKKHVEDESAVEMKSLAPAAGQNVPLMAGTASPARNLSPGPANEYNSQPGQAIGGNGYMGIGDRSPGLPQDGLNNMGYRGSPGPGMQGQRPGYGPPTPMAMGAQGRGYGPQDPYGNGGPQPQGYYPNNGQRPMPQRQFSNESSRALVPVRQYSDNSYDEYQAPPSRGPQPGPYDNYQTPPQRGPSRGPQPQRSYDDYQNNAPPPRGPSRGPTPGHPYDNYQNNPPPPRGPSRGPVVISPGPINNAGFDFGYGDQQQQQAPPPQHQGSRDNYGGGGAPVSPYGVASPPVEKPAYPGYKPYTPPPQQALGGIPESLSAGGGRGRPPPQVWDPVHQ
ncbi:hypothetical protein HYALB_00007461 [Hymenoscyphus albidus]|uniref:Fibroin-3 related protein n=1 Tax=Hymenoscyphus albidus TaxID=595503 RepID=A0A9N9LYF7_9HELO|nr:hypothetical protein HYALB_00007461 [Hymenoscyphus albidus]